ncbi:GDP-6-deoxy-D-talose 4-dehydrogenase [Planctomycetaceae bacterium]|nr:GDP-6-deoxy-D-talose 4-dehydrogenase [Planctomycetaceae bacterium]
MAPCRVLVTGLGGFTGRHLQPVLEARGHEVHGIATPNEPAAERLTPVDLLDAQGLSRAVARVRPQYVVHLAAISFVAHGDAAQIYATNIVGTRNLLEAVAALPACPGVLLASSANIYGNATHDPIAEDCPAQPSNDYAVSKCAMEQMAALWAERVPLTIVRPFNYTGVGQSENFLIPKIAAAFRRRASELELGNIEVERDFSDVRDVVEAYARLLERSPRGVFNICSGEATSLRQVLSLAGELTGHMPTVKVNPAFVRANEVKRLRGSGARLDAAIGTWRRRGMRETMRWMLEGGA